MLNSIDRMYYTNIHKFWADSRNREKQSKLIKELSRRPDVREKNSKRITEYNKSDAHKKIAAELGRKMFKAFQENPEIIERLRKHSSNLMKQINASPEHQQMLRDLVRSPEMRLISSQNVRRVNHVRWHLRSTTVITDTQSQSSVYNKCRD
jgi:hypothetical protein